MSELVTDLQQFSNGRAAAGINQDRKGDSDSAGSVAVLTADPSGVGSHMPERLSGRILFGEFFTFTDPVGGKFTDAEADLEGFVVIGSDFIHHLIAGNVFMRQLNMLL